MRILSVQHFTLPNAINLTKRGKIINPIEKLQAILKELESNKVQYITKPERDFTRNCKITFYDIMWFLLFIGANSMTEEIRRAFNYKAFSYISEAAIIKSRSKI